MIVDVIIDFLGVGGGGGVCFIVCGCVVVLSGLWIGSCGFCLILFVWFVKFGSGMFLVGVECFEEVMLVLVFVCWGSCGGGGNLFFKFMLLEGGLFEKDLEIVEVDWWGGRFGRGVFKLICKVFKFDIELEWLFVFGGDDEVIRWVGFFVIGGVGLCLIVCWVDCCVGCCCCCGFVGFEVRGRMGSLFFIGICFWCSVVVGLLMVDLVFKLVCLWGGGGGGVVFDWVGFEFLLIGFFLILVGRVDGLKGGGSFFGVVFDVEDERRVEILICLNGEVDMFEKDDKWDLDFGILI